MGGIQPDSTTTAAPATAIAPPDLRNSTPLAWRMGIACGLVALLAAAYGLDAYGGPRFRSACGVVFFFGVVALFSTNLRLVNWKTIGWGLALQFALALLVLKVPAAYRAFEVAGNVVKSFIGFSDQGAEFVFGNLANNKDIVLKEGAGDLFIFAFKVLPPILFASAFFTLMYHFGVLQWVVQLLSRAMVYLMKTSGAETLSVSANVFLGQTEAPLIVKKYVPKMTASELFTLMVSGFAHISGGLMVVYIGYGADPVAVLTTCVMACPGSLYLAKLFLPETATPETAGSADLKKSPSSNVKAANTVDSTTKKQDEEGDRKYVNAVDAIASGTRDGLQLALNVAAMLIVFIAFVAMIDALLGGIKPGLLYCRISPDALGFWPDDLSLRKMFGWLFSPAAFLMGVDTADAEKVGSLLGSKLAINEHYAYLQLKTWKATPDFMTPRSYQLAAFALTGFANFSSVGIQLGGIGAMAPDRRADLARLGGRALFVGFTATLLNAAMAGMLID